MKFNFECDFPSTIAAFPRLFIQIVKNKLAKIVSKLCSTPMSSHYFDIYLFSHLIYLGA